ncbi:MAG TPA: NUDIX domain-containing protein [Candidatus Limnocylindrales bacterium]|nr:NUDIX domain-containing protein [Candidatus Limnocylindrales bacterium]
MTPPPPTDRVLRISAHVVVLDGAGRIVLCRISEAGPGLGSWTLPGGGLEFGETPEAGAVREVAEETGLIVEIQGPVGTFSRLIPHSIAFGGRPLHWLSILYAGRAVGGELRDEIDNTTDRAAWFTEREARELPLVPLAERGLELAFGGLPAAAGSG